MPMDSPRTFATSRTFSYRQNPARVSGSCESSQMPSSFEWSHMISQFLISSKKTGKSLLEKREGQTNLAVSIAKEIIKEDLQSEIIQDGDQT